MNFFKWIMGTKEISGHTNATAVSVIRQSVKAVYDFSLSEINFEKHQCFEKIKPKGKKDNSFLALFNTAWNEYKSSQDSIVKETRPIILSTERTYQNSDVKEKDSISKVIEVRDFIVPPATVSVKAGLTIALGDFESFRIDIGLSLPVYAEEVDEVFPMAEKWIRARVHNAAVTAKGKNGKVLWEEPKLDFVKPKAEDVLY